MYGRGLGLERADVLGCGAVDGSQEGGVAAAQIVVGVLGLPELAVELA